VTWKLENGEHGDYLIVDVGTDHAIFSGFCGPGDADCVRYMIERANEGNAAYCAKLAAEGKLEIARVIRPGEREKP
jgi:hypothetical protein